MNKYNLQELNDLVFQVRRDIVRMVHAQNSGHPGGSLGCAEFFGSARGSFAQWLYGPNLEDAPFFSGTFGAHFDEQAQFACRFDQCLR